ncbi:MAG: YafY family transcriptional regulator [Candidatus Eremiobacteraeota bacterium]|nr:YafY family transcriptional regulator [Candidatus Eremiobacteraeota bacterium]
MLLLLQARGRMSARELANELEVSQRTVYRDIDSLSLSGVPVHAERGVTGGIVLADGYRKALTQFNEDEVRALFIAGDNPLADIGIGDRRPNALEKLAGALPEAQRRSVEIMRQRVYLDPRRWKQSEQPREHLATLRRAIWEDRCVRLHYKDRERKVSVRVIEPMGLVAKAGVWYLAARCNEEMRTFRAQRILKVEELSERFVRPPDFDLNAYWHAWSTQYEQNLPAHTVVVRVSPADVDDITAYWESTVIEAGKDSVLVRLMFPALEAAVHQIVAWGRKVTIVEPRELRVRVIACAKEALRQHRPPPTGDSSPRV